MARELRGHRRIIAATAVAFATAMASTAMASTAPMGAPNGDHDVEVRYDDYRLAVVELRDARDLRTLEIMGVTILNCRIGVGPMDCVLTQDAVDALRGLGMTVTVRHDNVQALIDEERDRIAQNNQLDRGSWYDDFKDLDAINARIDQLIAQYSDIASKEQIGTSLQGRPIYAITISGEGNPSEKPGICFGGLQHAREWISPMTVMWIFEQLVSGYDLDPAVADALDNATFYIIPYINPDGYVHTWGPNRLWRKNRRNNGDGTTGVDLNRNWSAGWGGPGSSGDGDSDTFRGPSAFSEPESTAVSQFVLANPNIVNYIDWHAYSQLILWPYGYDNTEPSEPDRTTHVQLGNAMQQAIQSVHGSFYTPQPAHDLYLASGIASDWSYDVAGAISFTFELRDTGQFGFILPPEQIIPNCQENMAAVMTLAAAVINGVSFGYPAGVPAMVDRSGGETLDLTINPIFSGPLDTSTGVMHYSINGGDPQQAPLTYLGGIAYEAMFPAMNCDDVISYWFEIQSEGGLSYRSPSSAPEDQFESTATDIVVAFGDDFESDLGWTVSGNAADGQWERGVPAGAGDRGDPTVDGDGSGSCYVTDNVAGNSDVDGGSTILTSPAMDASDPGAQLRYYRWYNNVAGADPMNDIFVVEVSDDNGASWKGLETVGPDGDEVSGGWYLKEWLIADIDGINNTENFRVRFNASDLNAGSVVEAGVDGVSISVVGCEPEFEPGDLDQDGDVDIDDLLALLANWGECDDCPPSCAGDIDGNCTVDVDDLLTMLGNWS